MKRNQNKSRKRLSRKRLSRKRSSRKRLSRKGSSRKGSSRKGSSGKGTSDGGPQNDKLTSKIIELKTELKTELNNLEISFRNEMDQKMKDLHLVLSSVCSYARNDGNNCPESILKRNVF